MYPFRLLLLQLELELVLLIRRRARLPFLLRSSAGRVIALGGSLQLLLVRLMRLSHPAVLLLVPIGVLELLCIHLLLVLHSLLGVDVLASFPRSALVSV